MTADIGRKIKDELDKQGMTISMLVKKTKLPQSSVDNVIYGRSKKRDIIVKIARVLSVPVAYFLEKDESNKFNHALYLQIFNLTYEQLVQHKLLITKDILDEYAYNTYLHSVEDRINDKEIIQSYLKGMISFGVRQGYLKKK